MDLATVTDQSAYLPPPGLWKYRKVFFDSVGKDVLVLGVAVRGSEYALCQESAKNQWSNDKKGVYGEGLLKMHDDPYRPNRIGKLGEMAFSCVYRTPIDLSYKRFGDKYDLKLSEKTVDIKTAASKHGNLLVRCESEKGKKIKIDKDLYVAQYLISENIPTKTAYIGIVGFCYKEEVLAAQTVHAMRGAGHKNKQIRYDFLHPVDELEKIFL